MGNISTILAALFCATAPFATPEGSLSKTEQTEPRLQLGEKAVSAVRAAYEKGEYREFLSEMTRSYEQADLQGLIETRQNEIPLDVQEQWEEKFSNLQKKKNQELLSAVSDEDDSPFAKKVRSAAANLSTPEQEKAISKLNSFIMMAPNTGANEDENRLIQIDLEYEYKLLHAQLPVEAESPQKQQEYQLALRMEKMDRMVSASKNFEDSSLRQAVALAAANFDARLARNVDGADLNKLANPSTPLEESVHSIVSSYQGQFTDLMREIDQG